MSKMIYFDHNSTTKISAECFAVISEIYKFPFNSSSLHQFGRKANSFLEEARQKIKQLINANNYEVTFVSSSTEATNTIFFGLDVTKILVAKTEHSSVFNCRPANCEFIEINVLENGIIDFIHLEEELEKISDHNFLVSVMLANNETGIIQPIEKIAKLVHQKSGLIHSDIVQAVGKIEVDLEKLNIDFASISSHKIYGPQGIGAIISRKGIDFKPLLLGGKQEKLKRAGTVNIAGAVGFGQACFDAKNNLKKFSEIKFLQNFIEKEIEKIGKENVKIIGKEVDRLPNTSCISTRKISNQTQLIHFDLQGIFLSTGSACSSGTIEKPRIMQAMKVEKDFSESSIRISFGLENTKQEAEKFIQAWHQIYSKYYD